MGSAPEENRFTVCEQARRVFYGSVFKGKKEILAEYRAWGMAILSAIALFAKNIEMRVRLPAEFAPFRGIRSNRERCKGVF